MAVFKIWADKNLSLCTRGELKESRDFISFSEMKAVYKHTKINKLIEVMNWLKDNNIKSSSFIHVKAIYKEKILEVDDVKYDVFQDLIFIEFGIDYEAVLFRLWFNE